MATAQDIIKGAMQKLGLVRKGETIDGDEGADGLVALNDMLASWSNESLLAVARVRENFTLTVGVGSYTIGTSQTFNTARPIHIVSAFIREGDLDYPLEIIPDEKYAEIGDKSDTSNIPAVLNYDNGYANGTIRLAPVPSVANQLHIFSEKQITAVSALSSTVDFPPGWSEAMKWNLAMRLAPEYGVPVTEEIKYFADQSLGNIKRGVLKNRPINYLPDERGVYSFNSDSWS